MAGRYSQSPAALLGGQRSSWASTGTAPLAGGSLACSGAGDGAERVTPSCSLAGSQPYSGLNAAASGPGPALERPRLPVTEAGQARPVLHFRLHGQDKVQQCIFARPSECRPTTNAVCKQRGCFTLTMHVVFVFKSG